MSIININSNYNIDYNNGYLTFISYGLSNNINCTLCQNTSDDLYLSFFNNDNTYNMVILPYSGDSIIGGNITLSYLEHVNLISFNGNWYQI